MEKNHLRSIALASAGIALCTDFVWQNWFGFSRSLDAGFRADNAGILLPILASLGLGFFFARDRPLKASGFAVVSCAGVEVLNGYFSTFLFEKYHGDSFERGAVMIWIISPGAALLAGLAMVAIAFLVRRKGRRM